MANIVLLAILGLVPDWRSDACDRQFAGEMEEQACTDRRDQGIAWATELANYIASEAERQNLDPIMLTSVAYRESHFQRGDICPIRIPLERIVSREPIADHPGKEKVCWIYRPPSAMNCQPLLVQEESDGSLVADRCAAGEAGIMQITYSESRPGTIVPATGEELPRAEVRRRARVLDPLVNISLGAAAVARHRDECCQGDECKDDWKEWIGSFNTGECSGRSAEGYASRVQHAYDMALEHICKESPDYEGCKPSDVEETQDLTEQQDQR